MALPYLELGGDAFSQGVEHGEVLRDRIARNLDVYFARFSRELGLPREEILRRTRACLDALADQDREYLAGMQGIARGSGFTLEEIGALNHRYELIYQAWGAQYVDLYGAPEADGCTSFAVLPTASANGHLLLGQNWDWLPDVQGAVVRTRASSGHTTLAFTEAGIFGGKIGLNSAGLGLAINGLLSTADDWSRLRLPFHVRCRRILESTRFEDAVQVVTGEPRSCSTNFLIAQTPDRAVDLEAAPEVCGMLRPVEGRLAHANNFADPAGLGVEEPYTPKRQWSCRRRERLTALLESRRKVGWADLAEFLQDHGDLPNSICRHPDPDLPEEQRSVTVVGVIMDLAEGRMAVSDGPPCTNPWTEYRLNGATPR